MTDFRLGGAIGAVAIDPLLATENMLQGIGMPLRPVDLGLLSLLGYGGLGNFSLTAISDIDNTPQVLPALFGAIAAPVDLVQDVANDALIFEKAGVWQVTVSFSVEFVSVNLGRKFQTEVYNQQDDAVFVSSTTSVGRNQEGSSVSATLLLDLLPSDVGERIQMRVVSSTDTFTSVNLNSFAYSAIQISQA